MLIMIQKATEQPVENEELWSYPLEELEDLLIEENYGARYLLWEGRLYECARD